MSSPSFDEQGFTRALAAGDFPVAQRLLAEADSGALIDYFDRMPADYRAISFRLLPKDEALAVFEHLDASNQAELVTRLRDDETASVFAQMDPDDRVDLLDELPAGVASRLLLGLSPAERDLTAVVLGYPKGSTGREMSPEVAVVPQDMDAATALRRVLGRLYDSETIYMIAVSDGTRRLVGVISLRDLLAADPNTSMAELARKADRALATEPAEVAARRVADRRRLALPVVDSEDRIVGILTVDDALDILQRANSEDQARQGGAEPLHRNYLSTPILRIVRSRIVWLLVLAVGASLTVQVLEVFEETLSRLVVLSVFVPLLIGTGGNTGNQAATTVTRALALGEVRPRDVLKVVAREASTGVILGFALGGLGFTVVGLLYGAALGSVIGLTLLTVCTLAATVGGTMPLLAKALRADPAVFSNPFISTFVDATGLIVYFLIAKAILGI
ncbi:MAG: magnesium transporter [Acidobacteriota bacterium]|nr:magnesium transporter [Acidobacteriota bacterium]